MSIDKVLKNAIEKHNNQQYEDARRLYKKILSTKPKHLDANYLLGTLYSECGDFENAKQLLTRASQIAPNSPLVQINLGNVHRKLKNPLLAVKCFTRAIQLQSNLFQAHLGLGSALMDLDLDLDKAAVCFQKALDLAPRVPEIYHQQGMLSVKFGNFIEALRLLKLAYNGNPNIPDINLDIGFIYLRDGDNEKAAQYFQEACLVSPNNIRGAFFFEIANGRTPNDDLMRKYSVFDFDGYADTFEKNLVEKLKYSLPFRAPVTLENICGSNFQFDSIVDLGCGTGLAGQALRKHANHLTGIDFSERMIEEAVKKNCFDQLYCGDIVTTLNELEGQYDLFLATDVFIYIGHIDELMAAVVSRATPGALFLFSTEKLDGEGLSFQKTGRFAHSSQYIHEVMKTYNCSVVSEEMIDLRLEVGSWLKGGLFVVRLPES